MRCSSQVTSEKKNCNEVRKRLYPVMNEWLWKEALKKQKCCFTFSPWNSERVFMHNNSIIHEKSQDWRVNWYFGGSWKFKRRYTAQILGGNPWLSWWFTSLAWIHFLPHNSPSLPSSNWQHAIAAADKWDSGFLCSLQFPISQSVVCSSLTCKSLMTPEGT